MGAVYLARDLQLERFVALKVARVSTGGSAKLMKRMETEAKAAATIDHPLICKVYEFGEIDGIRYIALQYIEGENLKSYLKRIGRIPEPAEAIQLVCQIAQALQSAHAQGVLHRDLKPENIMLNRQGEPVIMDFGLARRTTGTIDAGLTQGMIIGTAAYMSPEQAVGTAQGIDLRSDLYALGVILFEVLTGEWPFQGTAIEVMGRKYLQEPPSPLSLNSTLPPQLAAVCSKMIARNKDDRYGTCAEVIAALKALDLSASAVMATAGELPGPSEDILADLSDLMPPPIRRVKPARHNRNSKTTPAAVPATISPVLKLWMYAISAAFLIFLGNSLPQFLSRSPRPSSQPSPDVDNSLTAPVSSNNTNSAQNFAGATSGVIPANPDRGTSSPPGEVSVASPAPLPASSKIPENVIPATPPQPVSVAPTEISAQANLLTVPVSKDPGKGPVTPQFSVLSRKLAVEVINLGSNVEVDVGVNNLRWCPNLAALPNEPFRVHHISFQNSRVNHNAMIRISELAKSAGLRALTVTEPVNVSAAGLQSFQPLNLEYLAIHSPSKSRPLYAAIGEWRELRVLNVSNSGFGDEDLKSLANLDQLYWFVAYNTRISDAGIPELANMKGLTAMTLSKTRVTDAGCRKIRESVSPWFNAIALSDTTFSRKGLEEIIQIPRLHSLTVANTRLVDADIPLMAKIPNLVELVLDQLPLTDACVDDLISLKRMQNLSVKETRISPAGMARLRSGLPQSRISP